MYARAPQSTQPFPHQAGTDTVSPEGNRHGQVMNQATTTVMADQNGADDEPITERNKALVGVALEKSADLDC